MPHRDIIGSLLDVKPGGGLETAREEQGESAPSCCEGQPLYSGGTCVCVPVGDNINNISFHFQLDIHVVRVNSSTVEPLY